MDLLIGKQYHTIDEKNRTFIPAKFRTKLGDTIVVMNSAKENCLCLYSKESFYRYFDEIVANLRKIMDEDALTWLGANMEELQVDGQGRIALPMEFREKAGLEKNVVSTGAFDHVKLWDETVFEETMKKVDKTKVNAALANAEKPQHSTPAAGAKDS